jgi:hypothetical protein
VKWTLLTLVAAVILLGCGHAATATVPDSYAGTWAEDNGGPHGPHLVIVHQEGNQYTATWAAWTGVVSMKLTRQGRGLRGTATGSRGDTERVGLYYGPTGHTLLLRALGFPVGMPNTFHRVSLSTASPSPPTE